MSGRRVLPAAAGADGTGSETELRLALSPLDHDGMLTGC
jgi:hypothetical protein